MSSGQVLKYLYIWPLPQCYPGALAQSVEHLTFNQVVRGSNPRCFTGEKRHKPFIYAGLWRFCVSESKGISVVSLVLNISFSCHLIGKC